jgi:UDP-2,4-diacetamido-2,4,6-trideoxy-beta-L-altropyranose hydrolase
LISMRIIFRADASPKIGSGHVMRTSVVAEEAILRGHECVFVGSIVDMDWVRERIEGLGFKQIMLPNIFAPHERPQDILFLDSYSIDVKSHLVNKKYWRAIVLISDVLTPPYSNTIKILPGLREQDLNKLNDRTLSGPKYLPIRRSIQKTKAYEFESSSLRVAIVGGGSDPYNFVQEIAQLIPTLNVNFRGIFFTNDQSIGLDTKIHEVVKIGANFDELVKNCDAAITTSSTVALEFIAREIPIAVACAVDNQEGYYRELAELDLAVPIGKRSKDGIWELKSDQIGKLLGSKDLRDDLRQRMRGLVDLKGASRIVNMMEELADKL